MFAETCILCGQWLWTPRLFCRHCADQFRSFPLIDRLLPDLLVFSGFHYLDIVKTLIKKGKDPLVEGVLFKLAEEMAHKFVTESLIPVELVIPAPAKVFGNRDHAWAIAQGVSSALKAPVENELLERTGQTPQKELSIADRQRNHLKLSEKAMEFRCLNSSGLCILVDDVVTTGATLLEMRALLRQLGFENFSALTLASTPRIEIIETIGVI